MFLASGWVGLALVFFFSGSNALFLDRIGSDALPWVYMANAPLVIAAGFAYSAWVRRSRTAVVLRGSIWILAATVTVLWIWTLVTDGQAAPFALAVWFRFLLIFGLLGLWEILSAVFDVRQAKRLFPAIALGAMMAYVIGGVIVPVITALLGTVHLIAASAVCFVMYGLSFARAMEGADFADADAASPATPRDIVTDGFSRRLAAMRCITILLVFVTEFIFYEQVAATFASDESIARFLGIFMAVATLAMVVFTALASSRYIERFGLRVGLATMPAGLGFIAAIMAVWGIVFGIGTGFFVLAVVANLVNLVLTNGVEMPVGAVMYQPMPAERRMPVRVAVDGWLGSVAVLAAGLLLLAFDALNFATVVPFVWLLCAIAVAGVVLAWTLYRDYVEALTDATQLAFSGAQGSERLLADLAEESAGLQGSLVGDDPAGIFGMAFMISAVDASPLRLVLPELARSEDDAVAVMALDRLAETGEPMHGAVAAELVTDESRTDSVRTAALRCLHVLQPARAAAVAPSLVGGATGELAAEASAIGLAEDPATISRILQQAQAGDAAERAFAANVLAAAPPTHAFGNDLEQAVLSLIDDPNAEVRAQAMQAAHGRVSATLAPALLAAGARPEDRRRAVDALGTGGAAVVELLDGESASGTLDISDAYAVDLIDHVYGANTRRPAVLHRFLAPDARSEVRRAGFDAARRADVSLPATVVRMLRDDVEWARRVMAVFRDAAPPAAEADDSLLCLALADEFAAVRRAIWAGLRLAADPVRIGELESLASNTAGEQRANAIEVLDTLLPTETRRLVVPVLEPNDLREAIDLAADLGELQERQAALEELRAHPRTAKATQQQIDHELGSTTMSETIERILALKRVDIFSTLPYEILAELASVATEQDVAAGTAIINEGEFGDQLFALTAGEVQVDRGGAKTVLAAGTVFGELAVLDPGPRTATVTATSTCELLVVARSMLLALTDRRPEVMAEIARVLAVRLRG